MLLVVAAVLVPQIQLQARQAMTPYFLRILAAMAAHAQIKLAVRERPVQVQLLVAQALMAVVVAAAAVMAALVVLAQTGQAYTARAVAAEAQEPTTQPSPRMLVAQVVFMVLALAEAARLQQVLLLALKV